MSRQGPLRVPAKRARAAAVLASFTSDAASDETGQPSACMFSSKRSSSVRTGASAGS